MSIEEKKRSSLATILAIVVFGVFCIFMLIVLIYNNPIYNKDYESIINDIDADMPGYVIPIAKSIELINNRIADSVAYKKYNCTADEYEELLTEIEKDGEISRAYRERTESNSEILTYPESTYGLRYKLSYDIISAEKIEIEECDRNNGVMNMYDVEFKIIISGKPWKNNEVYEALFNYKIAEIDGEWMFYDNTFSGMTFIRTWDIEINGMSVE